MKALILAGGFGTRLRDIVKDVPKPMALVHEKPFLLRQMLLAKEQNVGEIILGVHYMANKIKSYFGNGKGFGLSIRYSEEETPLGTAGAIKNAEKYLDDTFFVLNGDSYAKIDLRDFLMFHNAKKSSFTISLAKSNDASRYGGVVLEGSKVKEFSEKKEEDSRGLEKLINAGVYIFEPEILNLIEQNKNVSLEREVFPKLVSDGRLYGYAYDGYFVDIGTPEGYAKFKGDILETLLINKESSIRDALLNIDKTGMDLALVVDKQKKLLGVLNRKIIDRHFLSKGNLDDGVGEAMVTDYTYSTTAEGEDSITEKLSGGTNRLPIVDEEGRITDIRYRVEEAREEKFPKFRGVAPLRISFAGGGTDVTHFFEKYGGAVISSTIDKYVHASIEKSADSVITISNPHLVKEDVVINSYKDISYDGRFDLIKALIKVAKPEFGFKLSMHNDIPPGRGLGSSASLAVLVIKLLGQLKGADYDAYQIANLAYQAEREEMKIKGGWQDFYAAAIGGFNFMEFDKERKISNPLRLDSTNSTINELNEHLLLCYVGREHSSGELHKKQEESFLKNEEEVAANLKELKGIAIDIKDCLLMGNLYRIGELLHKSWENKRKVDKNISSPRIDELYDAGLKNGAYGGKLLGAGGGGYLLFFYSPEKRYQLEQALEAHSGKILDFNFDFEGVRVWPCAPKVC
ncbi:NTP transferase domain-containing protein [Candidatus Pacearchaeota archaeon]|nr:NTP transferase domain-containing protein [Candidatus Pacearchaeota archaeon]